MVYKVILIFFLIGINSTFSKVIYNKNNIQVTNIEINNFINLYKSNSGAKLNNNQALKKIVLMKKTINFLIANNPELISILDKEISTQFVKIDLNEPMVKDYLMFQRIRNEFISEYFQTEFNIEQLELIFSSMNELKLPISKNNCLTIERMKEFKEDKYFLKNFLNNFKSGSKKFETLINNEIFSVCINDQFLKNIELIIVKFLEEKTEVQFNRYIYEKLI